MFYSHWLTVLCIWRLLKTLLFEKCRAHIILSFSVLFFLKRYGLKLAASFFQYSDCLRCCASLCSTQWWCCFSWQSFLQFTTHLVLSLLFCFLDDLHWQNCHLLWFPSLFCLVSYFSTCIFSDSTLTEACFWVSEIRSKALGFSTSIRLCSSCFGTSDKSNFSLKSIFWDFERVWSCLWLLVGFLTSYSQKQNPKVFRITFRVQIVCCSKLGSSWYPL